MMHAKVNLFPTLCVYILKPEGAAMKLSTKQSNSSQDVYTRYSSWAAVMECVHIISSSIGGDIMMTHPAAMMRWFDFQVRVGCAMENLFFIGGPLEMIPFHEFLFYALQARTMVLTYAYFLQSQLSCS